MASRQLGAEDGTVLFACSLCGVPARYPLEMRYTAERFFYCFRHRDTTTNLEEARKQGRGARVRDEMVPHFPVGVAPAWYLAAAGDDMPTGGGIVNGTTAAVTGAIGGMTAARAGTGSYTVTLPASLARTSLLGFVNAHTTVGAPIPTIVTKEPVSAQTMRVFLHDRLGNARDGNFDVVLWAV